MSTRDQLPATFFERRSDVNLSAYPAPHEEGPAKRAAKALILGAYKHLGLMRLQETVRASTHPPYMTILLFHRVTDRISPDGLTVGTSWFRDFCRLMKSNYHVVTLADINALLKSGQTPRRRTVAITFDDCYGDNLQAASILNEHRLPATFFVPTQYVETHHRFPWDQHLPAMPNLTWNDIRQIAALGHDIGSHTVSHADLAKLDDADALKELVDSRAVLEKQLRRPVKWFAFPFGSQANFRREQANLVARAGFEGSVSAIGGTVEMNMLGQVWPREAVPCFRSLTQLELHINRSLDWWYRLKRRVGMLS